MPGFWFFVLQCFYFMLPIYFANMAPVFMRKTFRFLATPVDLNKKFRGKPVLGEHKTFRGIFFAIIFGILIAFIQNYLYRHELFKNLSFFDYSSWLLFGFLTGFGAIFGDSLKSFLKRRMNIKPGDKFVPFDQIDFILGGLIFAMPVVRITIPIFMTSLALSIALLILANHAAFYLHIRNEKW